MDKQERRKELPFSFERETLVAYLPVTLYFALSLFAIMSSEFIVTFRTDMLFQNSQDTSYAVYSISVAAGVALFFFFAQRVLQHTLIRRVCIVVFLLAMLSVLVLASDGLLFWVSVVALFLAAGFNTGLVSTMLFQCYRLKAPVGMILSLASVCGLSLHYGLYLLTTLVTSKVTVP
ncbi:MAG: hypothetical protein LBJ07_00610, partial [Actinomycetes bacterium]|nr:hypothetical protein [Actinomycetes bacterium]